MITKKWLASCVLSSLSLFSEIQLSALTRGTITVAGAPQDVFFGADGFWYTSFADGSTSGVNKFRTTPELAIVGTLSNPNPSTTDGVCVSGTTGYCCLSTSNQLVAFDTSTMGTITTYGVDPVPREVLVVGDVAYISCKASNTLYTLNVQSGGTASFPVTTIGPIATDGSKLFVADNDAGNEAVKVYDISSTPLNPAYVGSVTFTNNPIISLAVTGGSPPSCYVVSNGTLSYFNSTTILPPPPVTSLSVQVNGTAAVIKGLAASGGRLVASISNGDLVYEYDIQGLVPTFSQSFEVGSAPDEIAIGGDTFAVCNINGTNLTIWSGAISPASFTSFEGNAGVMANLFNQINGQCPQPTQDIIDQVGALSLSAQETALNELSPQFKVIQFSLEKLDLLLHKEFDDALYSQVKETTPFVIAGYDRLNQDQVGPYNGYTVDNYYQLFGVTHGFEVLKLLFAVGATESYMTLNPTASTAKYPTKWVNFGLAGVGKRWMYGIDFQYGLSSLKTYRNIEAINKTAYSFHNAWNLSVDAKFAYAYQHDKCKITPYDNVGYIYGREEAYTESNATGNNFYVKNENISMIRNAIGLDLELLSNRSAQFFIDGAWVYEHYFNNNSYQAALVGTDIFETFSQALPKSSYARVHTGLRGVHKHLEWQLAYTGLFGKQRPSDNAGSVKFGYRY